MTKTIVTGVDVRTCADIASTGITSFDIFFQFIFCFPAYFVNAFFFNR